MDIRFHEFYLKFAHPKTGTDSEPPPLDDFAALCREAEQSGDGNDSWLQEAKDCLFVIAESSPLFAMAVSKWLTQEGSKSLARALVYHADVRRLNQTYPEHYDLSAIPEETRVLAGYRLCALAATPAISLGWVLSLATLPSSTSATNAAVEHLLKYLAEEYPVTIRRLLSSEESAFRSLDVAQETLSNLKAEHDWLEDQPRLKELVMTPEMRLTLSTVRRNESREIQRRSQEQSVLASLFTAKHFKYANRTAVEVRVGDQVKETTLEMSPYSISVELPLSERADPVLGNLGRSRLWRGGGQ